MSRPPAATCADIASHYVTARDVPKHMSKSRDSSTWTTMASLTALHEPILAAGDTAAAFMGSTYPFLLRSGSTEEQIARAYPSSIAVAI